MQNSFRYPQWNHLLYFLLQEIIVILKCSRYFICSKSIKNKSIFAWYLFVFSFTLREINADSHKIFRQAPFRIKKLNILPLVIYMVHDYSFIGSTADFVIKIETFGIFTGFGHLQTSEMLGRNMTGEPASAPSQKWMGKMKIWLWF